MMGTTPFLKVDKICQQISTTTLTIDNSIAFSTPFSTFTSTASTNLEVKSPSRIQSNGTKTRSQSLVYHKKLALKSFTSPLLGETAPFWNFHAASYPDLEALAPIPTTSNISHTVNENLSAVSRGDVYPVEFSMNQVLDPHWGVLYEEDLTGHKSHTVNILVNNAPRVLNLVTRVISRKGYNIHVWFFILISLAASPAEMEGLARITSVIPGTDESIEKLGQKRLLVIVRGRKIPGVTINIVQKSVPIATWALVLKVFLEIDLVHLKVTNEVSWHGLAEDQASVHPPYIMMTLNFDIHGFRPTVLKFPSAEKFSEVAKFIGTKFSSSESINFTADISKVE
uniref:Uncharacterized protein n=1 Tax=Lactuca sativa TaxID=4236 RepID=A0A9R1UWL6_LACSA|nr:hypothetical protein LSAT_V11C800434340 [Lactuca sativa]